MNWGSHHRRIAAGRCASLAGRSDALVPDVPGCPSDAATRRIACDRGMVPGGHTDEIHRAAVGGPAPGPELASTAGSCFWPDPATARTSWRTTSRPGCPTLSSSWRTAVTHGTGPTTGTTSWMVHRRRPGPFRRFAPASTPAARRETTERHPRHSVTGHNAPSSLTYRVPVGQRRRDRRLLDSLRPDLVVVHGTRIISARVLASAGCPVVNMHAGITPRYRGVHGGYWALAEQHPDWVGTTVHLVDAGIDTGGILAQNTFEVSDRRHNRHLPRPAPDAWSAAPRSPDGKGVVWSSSSHSRQASLQERVSTITPRSGATFGVAGATGSGKSRVAELSPAGHALTLASPERSRECGRHGKRLMRTWKGEHGRPARSPGDLAGLRAALGNAGPRHAERCPYGRLPSCP